MSRYNKARWWTLWPCGYTGTDGEYHIFGVKICYGDWRGSTHLLLDKGTVPLAYHPRIKRKDRDWLKKLLVENEMIKL